jgi:molybdopterin-guanine dinucleotide biosynthesis protein A
MGHDKAAVSYHAIPQFDYLAKILSAPCADVFISCRNDQPGFPGYKTIPDAFDFRSPLNGILSALQAHPEKAWLAVAVDMPFINETVIADLLLARNRDKLATSFLNPERNLPEPLLTIWEPRARDVLERYVKEGMISPQWILKHADVQLATVRDVKALYNVNSPGDWPYRSA